MEGPGGSPENKLTVGAAKSEAESNIREKRDGQLDGVGAYPLSSLGTQMRKTSRMDTMYDSPEYRVIAHKWYRNVRRAGGKTLKKKLRRAALLRYCVVRSGNHPPNTI